MTPERIKHVLTLLGKVVDAFIFSFFILISFYYANGAKEERQLREALAKEGIPTQAIVLSCGLSKNSSSITYQYEVILPNQEVRSYQGWEFYNYYWDCPKKGDQAAIRYLPQDPSKAGIEGENNYSTYIFLSGFTFVGFLGVLSLYIREERRKKKARIAEERKEEGIRLGNLGSDSYSQGQLDQAVAYSERALSIAREVGDRQSEGLWLGNLGNISYEQDRLDQASAFYEQALTIAREVGDRPNEGLWLGNLGNVYADLGQKKQARQCWQEAVTIFADLGSTQGEVFRRRLAGEE